ncbi:DUF2637 domain-containing protein [Streptacidiphilus carbonis]|uniref:DUF2637 domain-containing protein n=1 Tax=Streptacidiphilus carbonis TaxID=105422 RepID=UPI0005A6DD00|nr:DUF2637 domain-containing protein [Streptacidiphilus carbonis]
MNANVPPLGQGERMLLRTVAVAAVGVGGVGFAVSFQAVSAAGARWGFQVPQMLPIGIDTAIPVFTAAYLLLIRVDTPLSWVRFVPWALTAVTCWLNIAAGTTLSAKLAHGTMPLLWVVLSEVAAHVYASRIGAVTGRRMEKIRRSRWLLAFPSTFALWRRMTLWEITSYAVALERDQERQLAIADLRETYGKKWRRQAPHRTRVLLRLGKTAPAPTPPIPADAPPAEASVYRDPDPAPLAEVTALPAAVKTAAASVQRPRRATGSLPPAARSPRPPRSDAELLDQARTLTADWPLKRLTADSLRAAVHCSSASARTLRDALKAEREAADQAPEMAS